MTAVERGKLATTKPINLFLFFLFIFTWNQAIACKCNEPASIEDAYQSSSIVIHGKIISKEFVSILETLSDEKQDTARAYLEKQKPHIQNFDSQIFIKIKVEIIKTYKGAFLTDTVEIFTARKGASCGISWLEIGMDLIIYGCGESYMFNNFFNGIKGFEKENTYWTNQCTRTNGYNSEEAVELERIVKG